MRITKRSNIAMRVLMFCAVQPEKLVTKAEVAARCNASESHLAQIIHQMAQLGYLETQRGRNGGVMLGRPAREIIIGDVFRDIEAEFTASECFADVDNTCPLTSACRLRWAIGAAAEAFFAYLDTITLDTLVCDNFALERILLPTGCGAVARAVPG
ncbi:Rrf2 family transcriptional regulator [Pseudohalocynthiibacter aestuariivivens]|uniref:Rrf2 family transcriptional regulator n=1 Tax=Roseovarius pelagicus TaxID=2980108 RepID=A0ABY6D8R0_9RHOB|nr:MULTISPECIES: Rrf2 family transcriptional regulator [Rhodobacterales]QIE45571.1 Rrf2 family transcriptional regulator [Pseudohalocynthiibacter aestuariivivens]UXX82511.1 Rrf2 family transcriptional regulator [Roseovarius pelagicus]